MPKGLHVIKYPSGRYGFVGNVPKVLAFEGSESDCEIARVHGAGLARKIAERNGRTLTTRTWDVEAAAVACAESHGFKIG